MGPSPSWRPAPYWKLGVTWPLYETIRPEGPGMWQEPRNHGPSLVSPCVPCSCAGWSGVGAAERSGRREELLPWGPPTGPRPPAPPSLTLTSAGNRLGSDPRTAPEEFLLLSALGVVGDQVGGVSASPSSLRVASSSDSSLTEASEPGGRRAPFTGLQSSLILSSGPN